MIRLYAFVLILCFFVDPDSSAYFYFLLFEFCLELAMELM